MCDPNSCTYRLYEAVWTQICIAVLIMGTGTVPEMPMILYRLIRFIVRKDLIIEITVTLLVRHLGRKHID